MEVMTRRGKQEQQNNKNEEQSFLQENLTKSGNKEHLEYYFYMSYQNSIIQENSMFLTIPTCEESNERMTKTIMLA